MTARDEKHEGVPDRVLKTQAPPKMKDDTHRIQHSRLPREARKLSLERGLADLKRITTQVITVHLAQVEAVKEHVIINAVVVNEIE